MPKINSFKYLIIASFPLIFFALVAFFAIRQDQFDTKISEVESRLQFAVTIAGEKPPYMNLYERRKFYKEPAVSIAVINEGQFEWAKAYGNSGCGNLKSIHVNVNTLFQAGSISKPITAIGALLLVQQGKITLDENVNHYLKSWSIPENKFTKTEKITLRRLLSHTAGTSVHGFDGYTTNSYIPTTVEILQGHKSHVNSDPVRVINIPGKQIEYSGGGTTIVQLLIEDITSEKFDVWMKKNVLIPFGMNMSTFEQPLPKRELAMAACGHDKNGKLIFGGSRIYPEKAAAGLWTTPTDLAKFIVTIFNILHDKRAEFISKNLLAEAFTPQLKNGNTGLGFFLNSSGQNFAFGHGGVNEGFIANLVAYPQLKKGWIIMINNEGAWGLINEIERSIATVYNIPGFEPIIKTPIKLDKDELNKFTGNYQDIRDKANIIAVKPSKNNLYFVDSETVNAFQLFPLNQNTFFMREKKISIQFNFDSTNCYANSLNKLDNNGKIMTYEDGTKMLFKRIENIMSLSVS